MKLWELFDSDEGMIGHLRDLVMDYLTPLAAHKTESVQIQDIEEVLQFDHSGLIIDRGLIMDVIDPNKCRMVKRVEGDTVFIQFPVEDTMAQTEEDEERQAEKIKKTASNKAMKKVKDD